MNIKKNLTRTKDWFVDNKTTLLVSALAITATVATLQHHGIKSMNKFLEEEELFDKYYALDED